MTVSVLAGLRTVAVGAFLILSTAVVQAFTIQEVKSPGGITAWLVSEKAIPLISMNFSFKDGTAYDPPDKDGLATFLTGMMDEGAGSMQSKEFQAKRDALAFRMSFSAGKDRFEGSFQTLSRNRAASFDLLRLAITSPRFDPEPLERVRQQFLLNARDKANDPQNIAFGKFMQMALPGDVYAREDDGTEASLAAIGAGDLSAVHRRIFSRDTLQVAVVGDIDAAELGPLLDKVFGGLPASSARPPLPPADVAMGPLLEVTERDMPQSVIVFGHEGLSRDDPDFIPAYLMFEILGGGGFSSRLTDAIRERRGLTYGIGMELSPMERVGLYAGYMQTRNETAGDALKLIRETLAEMAGTGPTQAELDVAKTYLTGSYALRFTSNNAIANQLLGLQQDGLGIDYIGRRNSLVEAVTLDQVKAQAKRLLHPGRLIVAVVGKPQGLN
jgi:zinc protease